MRADKGNATVKMNVGEYEQKMNTLLQKGPRKELKNNRLNTIVKQINDGIKHVISD